MSYENLINGFIDGTLDSSQEETLFTAIASNEELRSQFKQHLAIDRTCKQYSATLAPPAQTTMGVFSSLGIKIKPIADPSTAATTGGIKGALLSKILYGVTGAIIATLLTSFVFIGYIIPEIKNDFTSNNANNSLNNLSVEQMLKAQDIPINIPLVTNFESKNIEKNNRSVNNNAIEKSKTVNTIKQIESEQVLNNNLINEDIKANNNQIAEITESNYISTNHPNANIYSRNTNNYNYLYKPDLSYMQRLTTLPRKTGIMVEVSGNQNYSLLNTSVPQAQNVNFANMGLNFLYSISNDFSLGIGIRHENFPQKYEGSDEAGNEFIYKQNPNLISLGLIGRYNFIKFGAFSLFGQAELGVNEAGVLGRIASGIEFSPENILYMNLGLEATGLRYYHNDKVFYTPKAGLFYSIGIKF